MHAYKLADYPSLQEFLRQELAATIAVPIDEDGTVHAAALLYHHTEDPLTFYFVTNKHTEKAQLLVKKTEVQAAAVIGTTKGTPFTLQMRGQLKIEDPKQHAEIVAAYYKKRGNRHDDVNHPDTLFLAFRPAWARFTDYAKGYDHFSLEV